VRGQVHLNFRMFSSSARPSLDCSMLIPRPGTFDLLDVSMYPVSCSARWGDRVIGGECSGEVYGSEGVVEEEEGVGDVSVYE
jgi:hypothetical protein